MAGVLAKAAGFDEIGAVSWLRSPAGEAAAFPAGTLSRKAEPSRADGARRWRTGLGPAVRWRIGPERPARFAIERGRRTNCLWVTFGQSPTTRECATASSGTSSPITTGGTSPSSWMRQSSTTAGLDPAHGYALISIDHGSTLRAAFGSVLYLGLIALLSLGIATVARDTAASTGIVLGLLYLPPLLAQLVSGPWHRHIEQIAPMAAGVAIQATRNIRSPPISPWAGLGVLAAWAAGLLLAGLAVLTARDA